MASERPIVTRLRSFEDRDVPDGSGSGATITERVYRNPDGPEAADIITELTEALRDCADDLEAEIEAKRGSVLERTTERDLASVRKARAALAKTEDQ